MSSLRRCSVKVLILCCLVGSAFCDDAAQASNAAANVKVEEAKEASKVENICDVCNCTADTIDCSGRNLTTTHYEWPKTPLRVVNFENNNITEVQPFPNVTINKLSFRNNRISKVDHAAFKAIANLTELDFSHNLLNHANFMPQSLEGKFSPNAYEPLPALRVLDLSYNQFKSLHHDLFEHVADLKVLILSGNPFGKFDEFLTVRAINSLYHLEELDISNCGLKKLSETTFHLTSELKKLDCSNNLFKHIPLALDETHKLETMILDGNPIEKLDKDNSFPLMSSLKYLSMRNMTKLFTIANGSMSNLVNLETLVIENCPLLMKIDEDALVFKSEGAGIATWPVMKRLNISNNALRYLPSGLLARWDLLEELHITNNPWSCDCDNMYLIGTVIPEYGHKLMGNETYELTCKSPPEHYNKTLPSLSTRHLRCLDRYGARPERDAAILVGLLVGVLLAIPIVLIMFVFWRRGFVCCAGNGPAGYARAFYKRAPPYEYDI